MTIPLSQDQLMERMKSAIQHRNLDAVLELTPRINWMNQYRNDALASYHDSDTFQKNSLLQYFEITITDKIKSKARNGNKAWQFFCHQSLDVMVKSGFRVLDDTYILDLTTQQVGVLPIIAKVCHDHKMRGDCGETLLHLAARQIPFLEGVRASFYPGSDVNDRNDDGQTAFHTMWLEHEVSVGGYGDDAWADTAQWLLDQGADPHLPDIFGRTGMDLMAEFIERSDDIVRLRPLTTMFAKLQSELDGTNLDAATPAATNARRRPTL